MHIASGLFSHMVLQRTADNVSAASIAGTASASGNVLATVLQDRQPLAGFTDLVVGQAAGTSFKARLDGLPVGGPYTIELTVGDETCQVDDVLVGDVWLLAGQSNMQGVGLLKEAPDGHPMVRNFYMDDRWDVAAETLHNLYAAVDPVHADICGGQNPARNPHAGVGPGLAFALTMRELTGVPQGTIACAHGGTSMTQWDPSRRDEGGKSLYGALVRRLRLNGGRVAGLLWYQGESDCGPEALERYSGRMGELIAAIRRDTQAPELPVAIVQISRVVFWEGEAERCWNAIQDLQRQLPESIERLATVPAVDLPLDDGIHISARGQKRLGKRLAGAMQTLCGDDASPPPIALAEVRLAPAEDRGQAVIHVRYDHVVGELTSGDRPWGFTLSLGDGRKRDFYDIRLQGNEALLYPGLGANELEDYRLHYGLGANPYCNIVDAADRSLPVFGPLTMFEPRARTPFCRLWRVSPVLTTGAEFGQAEPAELLLEPRSFDQDFADRHLEIADLPDDGVVYYQTSFRCPESMQLKGWLGYDGPVHVWLDGQRCFVDESGTNPATADEGSWEFAATAGRHRLLIALGTNRGRAWGVYLRLERLDVAIEKLKAGDAVPMPEWVA